MSTVPTLFVKNTTHKIVISHFVMKCFIILLQDCPITYWFRSGEASCRLFKCVTNPVPCGIIRGMQLTPDWCCLFYRFTHNSLYQKRAGLAGECDLLYLFTINIVRVQLNRIFECMFFWTHFITLGFITLIANT